MKRMGLVLLTLILLSTRLVFGQTVTPAPGTPLRKALMDALRQPVEKELKQPVTFTVGTLNATGDWAFGLLTPTQPNGKPIDYRKTIHWEAIKEGVFDNGICVLWQRKQGLWTVRTYVLGATDVPYGCWWKEYGAPKSVLSLAEQNCEFATKQ